MAADGHMEFNLGGYWLTSRRSGQRTSLHWLQTLKEVLGRDWAVSSRVASALAAGGYCGGWQILREVTVYCVVDRHMELRLQLGVFDQCTYLPSCHSYLPRPSVRKHRIECEHLNWGTE